MIFCTRLNSPDKKDAQVNRQRLKITTLITFLFIIPAPIAIAQEASNLIYLTDLVRHEGLKCERALRVEKALIESLPEENSWMLRCSNASYWIQVIPNVFTHIEKVDSRDDLSTVGSPWK
jgi:hypothetical protein